MTTRAALSSVALVALYLVGPGYGYARVNENAVASRFATPELIRVNGDDEAADIHDARSFEPRA